MGHTIIEKILLSHGDCQNIAPGDIVNVSIDARVARDFGGANVVNNLQKAGLKIEDAKKTFFTFDCNPGGSDQKYAANQQRCRLYARQNNIKVYDIQCGIGSHIAIEEELVFPGDTFVSTDSHANIMGAIGAFGQGMGDQDITAAWATGKVWFKTPVSVKITLRGKWPADVFAKDIALAMLQKFGANTLLGCAAEIYGDCLDELTLSDRITISSMATEMGAIAILFPPNEKIISNFETIAPSFSPFFADIDAHYREIYSLDISQLRPKIARPGHPEDVVAVAKVQGTKIDSAFIGSCTNGRYRDMKVAAQILDGKKLAPGVVLKIVPATRSVWKQCLKNGLLKIFQQVGALVGNPGCAGCAAGQIGQNGPGEVTISSGNRNFPGKQGGGDVYLASPATVAASAIAGMITTAGNIPQQPAVFEKTEIKYNPVVRSASAKPLCAKGRAWVIDCDNIDTDMIFHNRHLAIVDIEQMGQYALGNLQGWQNFSQKAQLGDIIFTGKNFGCGSSRQQAVDCFIALGLGAIIAESFGAIYERNAINAAFPILRLKHSLKELGIAQGDIIELDFTTGKISRQIDGKIFQVNPFFEVQRKIYQRGGLLKPIY